MTRLQSVQTEQEKENIIKYLTKQELPIGMTKHQNYNFKKRCEKFIIINKILYLKEEEGDHRMVLPDENKDVMKLEVEKCHKLNHYGMHKMEQYCAKLYFRIDREIIRNVVATCNLCTQCQPLKKYQKIKSIFATKPFERVQIDPMYLRKFVQESKGFNWMSVLVDVYSKFCITWSIKTKESTVDSR